MKTIIFISVLLTCAVLYPQKNDKFTFEGKQFKFIYYNSKGGFTNKFYVIINQDKNLNKCLNDKNAVYYFLDIPDIATENQEELFLEFANYITGRLKLIDSKFYIISDKEYTGLYKKTIKTSHKYKGTYLNSIEQEYINIAKIEICKIL